jgi:hypothetical protein
MRHVGPADHIFIHPVYIMYIPENARSRPQQ